MCHSILAPFAIPMKYYLRISTLNGSSHMVSLFEKNNSVVPLFSMNHHLDRMSSVEVFDLHFTRFQKPPLSTISINFSVRRTFIYKSLIHSYKSSIR